MLLLVLALPVAGFAQTTLDAPDPAAAPGLAGQAAGPGGFDATLVASVLGAGLRFMLPRTLEAYTVAQLSQWGLDGLTAIDPGLSVASDAGAVRLSAGGRILASLPAPGPGDIDGWTRAGTQLAGAAFAASTAVRAAGQQAVIQSFFDEIFNHLDPYSRYVPPLPADGERDARLGGAASAGVSLVDGEHYPLIGEINANGPAWAAGVDTGWAVLEVDGRSTRGQDARTVEGWMRGAPDTPLALILRGPHGGRLRGLTLQRQAVPPETVFAFRNGNVLILRIAGFAADTAQEVSGFLDEATQGASGQGASGQGASGGGTHLSGLIIDLRGNRGGVLQQAVTTVALLLDRGVVVITRGRDSEADKIWSVQGGDLTDGVPIVILVDGRTASAAEVMAAAMADQRRAVVIGSATLGKGLVQTIGQMPDGGELFVTWSRMLAPQGWPLQGLGVLPELCTSGGAESTAAQMAALGHGEDLLEAALVDWRRTRAPLPASRVLDLRANCPAAIGTDADLEAARLLVGDPARWKAALVPPQDQDAIE